MTECEHTKLYRNFCQHLAGNEVVTHTKIHWNLFKVYAIKITVACLQLRGIHILLLQVYINIPVDMVMHTQDTL